MDFSVLGPLEIAGPRGPVEVIAGRPATLLVALLLHAHRPVPIATLTACIWPADPPQCAAENIRTYVSKLRRMLVTANDDHADRLTSHPGAYQLDAAPAELDALRFTALSDEARQAMHSGDPTRAATSAGQAVSLWRGRPLAGVEVGPSLDAKAVWLEERRWTTFCTWIDARLALGDHAAVIPMLREQVAEQPLNEHLWARLAAALCRAGRTGDALAACAEARQVFVDELGIEPGAELAEAQAAILHGDSPAGGPSAAGPPGRCRHRPCRHGHRRGSTRWLRCSGRPTADGH